MKLIKNVDVLSKPILPTNKGKPFYSTIYGGILSILIFILMVAYFIVLISNPWEVTTTSNSRRALVENNFENLPSNPHRNLAKLYWKYMTKVSITEVGHDYRSDRTVFSPFLEGFNFAVREEDGVYDPTSYTYSWKTIKGFNLTIFDGKYCANNIFPPDLSRELDILAIDYYICPNEYQYLDMGGDPANLMFLFSYP